MKKHSGLFLLFVCLLFFSSSLLTSEEGLHSVWAVKDCRIVSLSGPVLEKGTIVIRDGLIDAVGEDIPVPADAEIFEASGLTAYPGLIDALGQSYLKLPETKFDPAKILSGDYTDKDKGITPELCAFEYVNLSRSVLDKYHRQGILTAHVLPDRGILTGQSTVVNLSSTDTHQALILRDLALGVGFSPASTLIYPNSLMGVVAYLRQEFTDAAYYEMKQERWNNLKNGITRQMYDPKLDLLAEYATGKKPVVFLCNNQNDILRVLRLVDELELDYYLCDLNNEAFRVIPQLKQAKARVILALNFKPPTTSIYSSKSREERDIAEKELYVQNAVKLAEAGIPFAFSSLGTDDPKSFMGGILKATAAGLSQEKALEALTTHAADMLGLGKALGTIEKGKIANLVLVEGDLLIEKPKVKCVFADGQKFQMKDIKVKEGEKPTVNITGNWEIDIEGAGFKFTIQFTQEEALLSGIMNTPFGTFDLTGGSVSKNEVYFEAMLSTGGQDVELYFTATVEGDTMQGTVIIGTQGSAEFTGKRLT